MNLLSQKELKTSTALALASKRARGGQKVSSAEKEKEKEKSAQRYTNANPRMVTSRTQSSEGGKGSGGIKYHPSFCLFFSSIA